MTGDQAAAPQAKRGTISPTMRAAIWQAHGQRCAYTGEYVSLMDVEIDHVIPIATTQEEFNKLVSANVIPPNFELNGLSNFLPTTAFQNTRKRARVPTETNLRHFLEIAATSGSEIDEPIAHSYSHVQKLLHLGQVCAAVEDRGLSPRRDL